MLQYAIPKAPQTFHRPSSVFADPPSKSQNVGYAYEQRNNYHKTTRPPSVNPQNSSSEQHQRHSSISSAGAGQLGISELPALSALAALAANAPAADTSNCGNTTRSSTPNTNAVMSGAPPATAGYGSQNGSSPPICANCQTSTTPLWRRDESGSVLCNACGLFLKLHGRPRPISLKTDVIKSRNRVKTSQPKKRDSNGADVVLHVTNGYTIAQPDGHQHSLPMGGMNGNAPDHHHRAPSPAVGSRSNTPSLTHHHSGSSMAPQHIFDTVSLPSDTFASPSLPAYNLPQPSPAPTTTSTTNGTGSHVNQSHNYEDLVHQNNALRTRVSELEVINDLFRGRVAELERSEYDAHHKERTYGEESQRLTADLAAAHARTADLERKLVELEDGPARKKARTESESVGESGLDVRSADA